MIYAPKVLVTQQYVENSATSKYTASSLAGSIGTVIEKPQE